MYVNNPINLFSYQILQRSVEAGRTIPLYADAKGAAASDAADVPLAEVTLGTLMTQPLEEQDHQHHHHHRHHHQSRSAASRRNKSMTETAVGKKSPSDIEKMFVECNYLLGKKRIQWSCQIMRDD